LSALNAANPIAVTPGLGIVEVDLPAAGLREADYVEPMSAPTLAKVRRSQQCIDNILDRRLRRRGILLHKTLDGLWRRRQTGQVEVQTAEKRVSIRIGHVLQILRLSFRQQKTIYRSARPGRILHRRRFAISNRQERPKLPALLDVDFLFHHDRFTIARVRSTHLNPTLEIVDDRIGQLILQRHVRCTIAGLERLDDETLGRLPHDERRS